MNEGLLVGSLVWRRDKYVGLADHYGVFVSYELVIHIDKSESGQLRVKSESLADFVDGEGWFYERRALAVPLNTIWERVAEVIKASPDYGLLAWGNSWNCESFARYISEGTARSEQADNANGALAIAGLLAGIIGIGIALDRATSEEETE